MISSLRSFVLLPISVISPYPIALLAVSSSGHWARQFVVRQRLKFFGKALFADDVDGAKPYSVGRLAA
jgi:hypothetical protein